MIKEMKENMSIAGDTQNKKNPPPPVWFSGKSSCSYLVLNGLKIKPKTRMELLDPSKYKTSDKIRSATLPHKTKQKIQTNKKTVSMIQFSDTDIHKWI